MTWAKVTDDFFEHPKVVRAGGDAALLYLAGLCYSTRHLTDGRIPAAIVPRLTDRKRPMALADRLVNCGEPGKAGLWERDGSDFRIHDFHDENETADEVRIRRAADLEHKIAAGRLGGQRSGEVRRSRKAEREAKEAAERQAETKQSASLERSRTASSGQAETKPHTDADTASASQEKKALSPAGDAREDRVGDPAPPLSVGRFSDLWRLATGKPITGNTDAIRDAARQCSEAAALLPLPPDSGFHATRLVGAFVELVAWYEAESKAGRLRCPPPRLTVEAFAGYGSSRNYAVQAADWLDGKKPQLGNDRPTNGKPAEPDNSQRAERQPLRKAAL